MSARTFPITITIAAVLGAPVAAGAPRRSTARRAPRPPLTTPRIAPLADSELTEAHKAIVARFTRDGKANNALQNAVARARAGRGGDAPTPPTSRTRRRSRRGTGSS